MERVCPLTPLEQKWGQLSYDRIWHCLKLRRSRLCIYHSLRGIAETRKRDDLYWPCIGRPGTCSEHVLNMSALSVTFLCIIVNARVTCMAVQVSSFNRRQATLSDQTPWWSRSSCSGVLSQIRLSLAATFSPPSTRSANIASQGIPESL